MRRSSQIRKAKRLWVPAGAARTCVHSMAPFPSPFNERTAESHDVDWHRARHGVMDYADMVDASNPDRAAILEALAEDGQTGPSGQRARSNHARADTSSGNNSLKARRESVPMFMVCTWPECRPVARGETRARLRRPSPRLQTAPRIRAADTAGAPLPGPRQLQAHG